MKSLTGSHIWLPKLDKNIEDLASSCVSCQRATQVPPSASLNPWLWPTNLGAGSMYICRTLLGQSVFLAVDAHSKWLEISIISDATTYHTITTDICSIRSTKCQITDVYF